MPSAIIKTRPSVVEGTSLTIFIEYSDGFTDSVYCSASMSEQECIAEARLKASQRVAEMKKAQELAKELEKYHEEVIE